MGLEACLPPPPGKLKNLGSLGCYFCNLGAFVIKNLRLWTTNYGIVAKYSIRRILLIKKVQDKGPPILNLPMGLLIGLEYRFSNLA